MQTAAELPVVLKVTDLMEILRCSKPKAYQLVQQAEKENLFQVRRIGKMPRISRDSFLAWMSGENEMKGGQA